MKKFLLIALLLSVSAGMAMAQQGGPGSPPGGKGNQGNSQSGNFQNGNRGGSVERLIEQLGLDEIQAAEVAAIFEDAQLAREEERERVRAASEETRANTHAQIMEVLTPEQQALFEDMLQKREALRQALDEIRAERGYGGGGRGNGDCNG